MSDLSSIKDFSRSITRAYNEIQKFRNVYSFLEDGLKTYYYEGTHLVKQNENNTEYQGQEKNIERSADNDRVFPLETVTLKQFNSDHDKDLSKALIHVGPYADEYARSLNALALTIGMDIFFRDNAFDTGKEEGRKTLAHELTHVAQYEEGRINNDSVKELEAEAAVSEKQEGYTDDDYFLFTIDGKAYRIKFSEMDARAEELAEYIDRRIYEQRYLIDEEDYLKLLIAYKNMLERRTWDDIFDTF